MYCYRAVLPVLLLTPAVAAPVPGGKVGEICARLTEHAKQMDHLLRTVSNRESADRAAAEFRAHAEAIRTLLASLEQLSATERGADSGLAEGMQQVTRIFQGFLPVLARIHEVNAYGSAELEEATRALIIEPREQDSALESLPRARAYSEMIDALDGIVFELRLIRSGEEAEAAAPRLAAGLALLLEHREALARLPHPGAEEALQTLRPLIKQWGDLLNQANAERARLLRADYFNSPTLRRIMLQLPLDN